MKDRGSIPRLTAEDRAQLRELAERDGIERAAQAVGLSREAYLRVMADLPRQRGSEVIAYLYLHPRLASGAE